MENLDPHHPTRDQVIRLAALEHAVDVAKAGLGGRESVLDTAKAYAEFLTGSED